MKKMFRRSQTSVLLVFTIILSLYLVSGCAKNEVKSNSHSNDYWITAFYFADGWPKEFWDCEMNDLDKDFRQIKADGFNSIALVIPWRQFQPEISTDPYGVIYDEASFLRLSQIIEKANEYQLGVLLRVGYFWDRAGNAPTDDLYSRFQQLIYDENTKRAWCDYVAKVKTEADKHENVLGAFICWEDMWTFVNRVQGGYPEEEALSLADEVGFQAYIEQQYELREYNQLFHRSYEDYRDIPLPDISNPEMQVFYDFYDTRLNQLLNETQKIWPELSMEVRTDADLVADDKGDFTYYSHAKTYSCGSAAYTSVMYGIPQGARNEGERLTATEAIPMTRWVLESIQENNEGKPIYINQFLFYDDTAKFSYNAQLYDDQIDDYLSACADVLAGETCGYGIWTYRDYFFNFIYNKDFLHGLDGWQTEGDVMLLTGENSRVKIATGGVLSQHQIDGYASADDSFEVCLSVETDEACTISVRVGTETREKSIEAGETRITLTFPVGESGCDLAIWADRDIVVDNINLYGGIQHGRVYEVDGNQSVNYQDVVGLNHKVMNQWSRIDLIELFPNASVKGREKTADTPWNTNIGIIDGTSGGNAIFMQPGTAFSYQIPVETGNETLSVSAGMFTESIKWGISDGARLTVRINGESVLQSDILADGELATFSYPLAAYRDTTIQLTIECDGGDLENCEGDWVVIENADIQQCVF